MPARRNLSLLRVAGVFVGLIGWIAGAGEGGWLDAAPPSRAEERDALLSGIEQVTVAPAAVSLTGPHDACQLVVTGLRADGLSRDLTPIVTAQAQPAGIVDIHDHLFLRPRKEGSTVLTLQAGGRTLTVPVTVSGLGKPEPVSFRRDVIAALNVGGCNMGACHGTPSGKNGFRLSLRGFDPAADYHQLTRDVFGRRTDKHDPEQSLLLLKGVGHVPHEGGMRFGFDSLPSEMIRAWLAAGTPDDPKDLPPLAEIQVTPPGRILHAPARWQQLAVNARFADGRSRDVTRLSNFSSSDTSIADVSANGLVEFKRPGEVAIICRYLENLVSIRLTYLEPREDFRFPPIPEVNFIDQHVFAKLKQMGLLPSELCSDTDFIRRAYLDAIGRLPTPEEVTQFLADQAPDKRQRLIDQVLNDPLYADFWALKWADVLRSTRRTLQTKGSYAFQLWLRDHWRKNTPVDQVVRQLLTATGNTYENPPANYYRIAKDPSSLAETTAQLFLGVRMQCAKCHNHPFERWTQDDYYGFAAWFARTKQKADPALGGKGNPRVAAAEVVYLARDGEVTQPRSGRVMKPHFPGGTDADVPPQQDRRAVLADWLTRPDNPFFARSVVNRVWFHVMGRGIVEPVDDFRESNPACNDELLDALAQDFVRHAYDLKHLIRTIMVSRTYQLSSEPNDNNREDNKYFSHAVSKLLTAEQLLDALCDVTGLPEKFPELPRGTRAIQLPDGEVNHPFLKTFGQPARELPCECERESDGNLAQALQLINGPTVNDKLRSPDNRIGRMLQANKSPTEMLHELYLVTLSRPPAEDETRLALAHLAKSTDPRKAWEDILWALINTREFLFRH